MPGKPFEVSWAFVWLAKNKQDVASVAVRSALIVILFWFKNKTLRNLDGLNR
jgi:hypothetical protein